MKKTLIQLDQILNIKVWTEANRRLPGRGKNADEEEKILANQLNNIRTWLREDNEIEGKEEIRKILEELDLKYNERKIKYGESCPYLVRLSEIEKWIRENKKLPQDSEMSSEEERKLAVQLKHIRTWLKDGRSRKEKEEVEKLIEVLDVMYNERILLRTNQITEIKNWIEKHGHLPGQRKDSDDEEIKLNIKLNEIRVWLKKEKNKIANNKIGQILEELDLKYNEKKIKYGEESVYLYKAKKIKEWADINGRLPVFGKNVSEDERELAFHLRKIRDRIRTPKNIKSKEKIKQIINELDEKYGKKKKNAQEIGRATYQVSVEMCDDIKRDMLQITQSKIR